MSDDVQVALIQAAVPFLGLALLVALVVVNRAALRGMLGRATRVTFAGVGIEVAADGLRHAARPVSAAVSQRLRERALRLADRTAGMRVLWADDEPLGNSAERSFLRAAGAVVVNVTSTAAALEQLELDDWDVVVTDFSRGGDEGAGIELATQARAKGIVVPFVGYVGTSVPGTPAPFHSVQSTPDGLIDAVLDLADRRA